MNAFEAINIEAKLNAVLKTRDRLSKQVKTLKGKNQKIDKTRNFQVGKSSNNVEKLS